MEDDFTFSVGDVLRNKNKSPEERTYGPPIDKFNAWIEKYGKKVSDKDKPLAKVLPFKKTDVTESEYADIVEAVTNELLEEPAGGASAYWAARKERDAKRKAAGFPPPMTRKQQDERRSREIDAHFARGGPHDRGECGPVCTAFDW